MNALLKRIRPARAETSETVTDSAPSVVETPATLLEPAPAPVSDPAPSARAERPGPAGIAPEELIGERPDTRRRGRLRRRMRHLRRVRELMLRDVGGLVYEVHRAGDTAVGGQSAGLVRAKLERLETLDAERHELETTLDDLRRGIVLREPGVGGTCPTCGEYFASEAHFCSNCGTRVDGVAPTQAATPDETAPTPPPAPAATPVEPAP